MNTSGRANVPGLELHNILSEMVDEGLLQMSVSENGKALWTPTQKGAVELGMMMDLDPV